MINIISRENRHLFHHTLMEMHAQRKQVFIDQLCWPLEECAGIEMDAFDGESTLYLIETAPDGAVVCSARLLPSMCPHLLGEVFEHICMQGAPRSDTIWEASRFCPAPETSKGQERRDMLMRMIAAIMEASILFGMEQVTFVAGAALARLARKAGWDVELLGPMQRVGRERLTAMIAHATSAGLNRVRSLNGLEGPVTRYADPALSRAA